MRPSVLASLLLLSACAAGDDEPPITAVAPPLGAGPGLLDGAVTYVPAAANPGYVSFDDGTPFAIDTRITAVQFHVPGVPSGRPGGLSPRPHPVLKVENGVPYWRVTGELSAQVVDYLGFRYVLGPIGRDGVDHRFDADRTHPRGRLPGAFFVLRFPILGWNGRLIDHQAPGDGGFGWPAAPLTDLPLDPVALLDRGYALFSVGLGGTVMSGDLDGEPTVDTNPESGSGIFWTGTPVSYLRPARIAADGRESAFPRPTIRHADFEGGFDVDLGDPDIASVRQVVLQGTPELARDGVVVAKNLLRRYTGRAPSWTAFLGWSGAGEAADALNGGRVNGWINIPRPGRVPYNGGNLNAFHDPRSGRRFDAFLLMAGGSTGYLQPGDEAWNETELDDRYPAVAPMVWIGGDNDSTGASLMGYLYANRIARALPGSAQAGTRLEDLIAVYSVRGLTHVTSDYLFANPTRYGRKALCYADDPAVGLNRRGVGKPVQPIQVELARATGGELDLAGLHLYADGPRTTPLFLQSLENLWALTTFGTPLPVSRVQGDLFARLPSLTYDDRYPLLPLAPCTPFDETQDLVTAADACTALVTEDSALPAHFGNGYEVPAPFEPVFLDEARWFAAHNPLPRVVGSLEVPDVAAALGPRLFAFNTTLERRLSDADLRLRYGSHDGWVSVFRAASAALVRDRLWEPRLGAVYVDEAARSDVLRR